MTAKRSTRVAERVREELAVQIRDLSDPRIDSAFVSRVEVTDDLQHARVYVRRESGSPDARDQKKLLAGFEAASPRLRRQLAKAVGLRYAPELRFYYDDAPDVVARVEEVLRELEREKKD